jgi:hypothetical protein
MRKLQVAILAVALAAAGSARASVTLELTSVSPVAIVTLNASGTVSIVNEGVYAGIYNLTVNGVATPSFCIDIARDQTENVPYTGYNYTALSAAPLSPSGPMGTAAAIDIEKLWAAYYTSALSDSSGVTAAALQVAIWEDIANKVSGYSLTVSGNNAVTSEATTMLANLGNLTAQADLEALVLSQSSGQGYVVAVPEPATMIAGALLLLPFGASTLRILRRKRMA